VSGVIALDLEHSTAFLNWMVVAPLEADCWYGISTPCSMVASFWFAVMTRGEGDDVRLRLRLGSRQLQVDEKLLPRMRGRSNPRGSRPAG